MLCILTRQYYTAKVMGALRSSKIDISIITEIEIYRDWFGLFTYEVPPLI